MGAKLRRRAALVLLLFVLVTQTAGACENDCKSPVGIGSDAYCNQGDKIND